MATARSLRVVVSNIWRWVRQAKFERAVLSAKRHPTPNGGNCSLTIRTPRGGEYLCRDACCNPDLRSVRLFLEIFSVYFRVAFRIRANCRVGRRLSGFGLIHVARGARQKSAREKYNEVECLCRGGCVRGSGRNDRRRGGSLRPYQSVLEGSGCAARPALPLLTARQSASRRPRPLEPQEPPGRA